MIFSDGYAAVKVVKQENNYLFIYDHKRVFKGTKYDIDEFAVMQRMIIDLLLECNSWLSLLTGDS